MTATKLMEILKEHEFGGATGKPRKVSVSFNDVYEIIEPDVEVTETGDGFFGADMTINFKGENCGVCEHNTFGDYVRGMTDKELAIFLYDVWACSGSSDIAFPYKDTVKRMFNTEEIEELLGKEIEDEDEQS